MNSIGDFEFYQYLTAADYLKELKGIHNLEIQRLYDDIHPRRTTIDSELGVMYSESMNVEDYVIWIIETKERLAKQRAYYQQKADIFSKAIKSLNGEERISFKEAVKSDDFLNHPVTKKIKSFLEKQITKEHLLVLIDGDKS